MTTSKNYAIYRHQKVKTLGELKGRSQHNNRTASRGIEHADRARPARLIFGEDDAVKAWHEKTEAAGITKLRKNAVIAVESLATASSGWWKGASPEDREQWLEQSRDFLIEKAGGADNILSIHFHEDETTPHLQALSVPIVTKEMKRRGRPRKDGKQSQTYTKATLSAADVVGGSRDRLTDWQTEYAARVAHLGLRRGIPRKETGDRNKAPAHWRAEQARELDQHKRAREAAENFARDAAKKKHEAAETLEVSRAEAKSIVSTADDRAEALHLGFEAVEAGELVYRPQTAKKPPGLSCERRQADSKLPPTGSAFDRFKSGVQPYLKSLTAHARRIARLRQREVGVEQRETEIQQREAAVKDREMAAESRHAALDKREAAVKTEEGYNKAAAARIQNKVDDVNSMVKAVKKLGYADEVSREIAKQRAKEARQRDGDPR